MKTKHRKPIIAICVVVVFLGFFIGILLACARRFNQKAIARRAHEAQQSAAEALSREERHRRHRDNDLDHLPEAEVVTSSKKFTGPALGNVVIKDPAAFMKMKDELVEVAVPQLSPSLTAQKPSAAAAGQSEELSETFGNNIPNEPLSPLHQQQRMTPLNLFARVDAGGEENGELPSMESLADGGFVIVVCGDRVGSDAANSAAGASAASFMESQGGGAESAAAKSTRSPMIHFYRHQPSRSFYGESRYTDEAAASFV